MSATYYFMKALLDPVVFIIGLTIVAVLYLVKRNENRKGIIVLIISFSLFYAASISPVANMLCYMIEKDYLLNDGNTTPQLDVIVVLGGGISGNEYISETMPSRETALRLLHGVQLFRTTGARHIVFSGKGTGKITEAEIMGNAAEKLNIRRDEIMLELKSDNTKEQAEELHKMLKNKDMKIGLVTSAYHMKRSVHEFRKYFRNIAPLPTDYLYSSAQLSLTSFIPKSVNLYKFSTALREMIGQTWYRARG